MSEAKHTMVRRIAKQRRIVERLRAQLSFELLVLERLERRASPKAAEAPSVGRILSNARGRRAERASEDLRQDG